jgi:hypothetical protein
MICISGSLLPCVKSYSILILVSGSIATTHVQSFLARAHLHQGRCEVQCWIWLLLLLLIILPGSRDPLLLRNVPVIVLLELFFIVVVFISRVSLLIKLIWLSSYLRLIECQVVIVILRLINCKLMSFFKLLILLIIEGFFMGDLVTVRSVEPGGTRLDAIYLWIVCSSSVWSYPCPSCIDSAACTSRDPFSRVFIWRLTMVVKLILIRGIRR